MIKIGLIFDGVGRHDFHKTSNPADWCKSFVTICLWLLGRLTCLLTDETCMYNLEGGEKEA